MAEDTDIRQIIVVRKDLNMRKGKIAAQAAHASLGIFFQRLHPMIISEPTNFYEIELTDEMKAWKEGIFTKICVYVNSDEELNQVYHNAMEAGLPAILITDRGLTEFGGKLTNTCCAIGPARKDRLDPITGHLPLY